MKHLILIRHAKSSWGDDDTDDYDRVLKKRGRRDALRIGAFLQDQGIFPDCIWCSSAERARLTLKGMRKEWDIERERIRYRRDLYQCSVTDVLSHLTQTHDSIRELMIIGHNPCLEDLWNWLLPEPGEKFVTGAVARIAIKINRWKDMLKQERQARLKLFQVPKKLPR